MLFVITIFNLKKNDHFVLTISNTLDYFSVIVVYSCFTDFRKTKN